MSQENEVAITDVDDLCDLLDSMIISSQCPSSIILPSICLLLSKWLMRFQGDKESAVNSFRENGIPTVETAIGLVEDESITFH